MARKHKLHDRSARQDAAYRRAKQEGFAARAVYKLEELDRRFKLLSPGRRVLDLGCWPGSWMQYAAQRVGQEGLVVGVDLRPVELALPPWCEPVVADVEELSPQALLERFGPFDTVLSDMAPKTIGDATTDRLRSEALFERALHLALAVLRPGGHFAGKVFQGGGFGELLAQVRGAFSQSKPFHTKATRTGSAEHYLVGQGLRGSAAESGQTTG
ncbi:MAG: RlmE family RNA methyltransferase [Myxococcales bacterium]|nr:RlmE family RNA methyltransferase [Myxococcales bacterium]